MAVYGTLVYLLSMALAVGAIDLWLGCSCLLTTQRHSGWSVVGLNAKTMSSAKNNCYLIFINGLPDEIVALRFKHLQLAASCSHNVEIFPYLRELVIENSTEPEYVICNSSASATHDATYLTGSDETIFSSGDILGLRVQSENTSLFPLNVTAEYRFLKKDNFRNDGRLIEGTYCDYYFFANVDNSFTIWQYFHSPRFPAKYPAHIKCAYKFLGRPENIVEIVFEELKLPQHNNSCNLDTLTIFDAESANMNNVIDVISSRNVKKRFVSTGPDLLIEFNASSNMTEKGFRGRYRFLPFVQNVANMTAQAGCHEIYNSRVNKTGKFETAQILANRATSAVDSHMANNSITCRFEFYGNTSERVQIKFLDFNLPTMHKNSSECNPSNSLQVLRKFRDQYEIDEMFCGVFLPKPIMSSESPLVLQFVGQAPQIENKHSFYGFKAEYRFLTNFGITSGSQLGNSCNFVYNSTNRKAGIFSSPNFPGLYPQNMICNYYFYGEAKEKVIINMTYFDVEGVGNCEYLTASDYVELSNFMTVDRKFSKYCGKFSNKFQVQSDDNFFRVTFHSNDRFDKTGFRANYQFVIPKANIITNASEKSYLYSQANPTIPEYNIYIQWLLIICSSTAMNFSIICLAIRRPCFCYI